MTTEARTCSSSLHVARNTPPGASRHPPLGGGQDRGNAPLREGECPGFSHTVAPLREGGCPTGAGGSTPCETRDRNRECARDPDGRVAWIDALRGLLVLLAGAEHLRQIGTGVILAETAATPGFAASRTAGGWLRFLTHGVPVGFFFLLGVSMQLRHARAGSPRGLRGLLPFVRRALLLALFQLFLENPGWAVPLLGDTATLRTAAAEPVYLGVLFSLGVATLLCAPLVLARRARFAALAAVVLLATCLVPWPTAFGGVAVPFAPLPWAGWTALGIACAKRNRFLVTWLGFQTLFPAALLGVAVALLPFTKYPPSPAFFLWAGFSFWALLWGGVERLRPGTVAFEALRLFGRHSLLAYLLPLYVAGAAVLLAGGAPLGAAGMVVTGLESFLIVGVACLARERGRENFGFFAPGYDAFARLFRLHPTAALADAFARLGARGPLLDAGGGTGALAAAVLKRRPELGPATVLDPAPAMLARARRRGLTAEEGSAAAIPSPDGAFGAILLADALHHVHPARQALDEAARVLRPGGALVILDFNVRSTLRGRLFALFERLFIDRSEFFAQDELARELAARGFRGSVRPVGRIAYLYEGTRQENSTP